MQIVIATYTFLPEIGGVEVNVATLAEGFAKAGHDVTVTTLSPGSNDGYPYRVVRDPNPFQLCRLYKRADILIHSNLALKLIYPMLFLRRRFALRHHSESAFQLSHRLWSRDIVRRVIYRRATHFVTSEHIGRKSGLAEYIVTHPFAPLNIKPGDALPAEERDNLVFAGRLTHEKGVLFLLDRWSELRRVLGIDRLLIVGDGELRHEVERRISAGVVEHVHFCGRLTHHETLKEMGRAAFAVVPSLWDEPFGAAALEALAMGALVVHSDRGGLPETTGKLGFIFDPGNHKSWLVALDKARAARERQLASPTERGRYLADVAAHSARFTPEIVVGKIIDAMVGERGRDARTGRPRARRVAFVLPTYLPETFGGGEQQARKIATALARRGVSVTVLAPRTKHTTDRSERDGSVEIRRFRLWHSPNLGGRYMVSFLAWSLSLILWIWRHRSECDVIHVIHGRLHAVPAVIAGAVTGIPTLIKIGRGGESFDLRTVKRKRILGSTFAYVIGRFSSAFIANSREIYCDLRRWGIPDERIYRIPNGVEVSDLGGPPSKRDHLNLVFLGRLDPEKAIDILIQGFGRLPPSIGARLTIAGNGPCREALEILVRELDLQDRVEFAGVIEDVGTLLSQADLFVSTSLAEGMSNALLEAMSFAVLPVVSDVSGVAEIVEDGRTGFVFAPGDIDKFANKLAQAVALSASKRRAMGRAALETVHRRFAIDDIAERHLALYEKMDRA